MLLFFSECFVVNRYRVSEELNFYLNSTNESYHMILCELYKCNVRTNKNNIRIIALEESIVSIEG